MEINRLRGELRSLRKQFKRETEQEKIDFSELRDIIRKKLEPNHISKAEERQEDERETDSSVYLQPIQVLQNPAQWW